MLSKYRTKILLPSLSLIRMITTECKSGLRICHNNNHHFERKVRFMGCVYRKHFIILIEDSSSGCFNSHCHISYNYFNINNKSFVSDVIFVSCKPDSTDVLNLKIQIGLFWISRIRYYVSIWIKVNTINNSIKWFGNKMLK